MKSLTESEGSLQVKRAYLFGSNSEYLVSIALQLSAMKIDLISSGITAAKLSQAGLPVRDVSYPNYSMLMHGQDKFNKFVQISERRKNRDDVRISDINFVLPVDLLVLDFYHPSKEFRGLKLNTEKVIKCSDPECFALLLEGLMSIRRVGVVTDSNQYSSLITELQSHDKSLTLKYREKLAQQASKDFYGYAGELRAFFERPVSTVGIFMKAYRKFSQMPFLKTLKNS